jgi:hypothetical protein
MFKTLSDKNLVEEFEGYFKKESEVNYILYCHKKLKNE